MLEESMGLEMADLVHNLLPLALGRVLVHAAAPYVLLHELTGLLLCQFHALPYLHPLEEVLKETLKEGLREGIIVGVVEIQDILAVGCTFLVL